MLFDIDCPVAACLNNGEDWYFRPSKLSLRWRAFVLSEEASLSGERVSPKRELMGA